MVNCEIIDKRTSSFYIAGAYQEPNRGEGVRPIREVLERGGGSSQNRGGPEQELPQGRQTSGDHQDGGDGAERGAHRTMDLCGGKT